MTVKHPPKTGKPIEHCAFGSLKIRGKRFGSDLFIFPDGHIEDNWWRKEGHRLFVEDLAKLLAAKPRTLVIGTGYYGNMALAPDLKAHLKDHGVDHIVAEPTCSAAERFNDLSGSAPDVAGCFHLTC